LNSNARNKAEIVVRAVGPPPNFTGKNMFTAWLENPNFSWIEEAYDYLNGSEVGSKGLEPKRVQGLTLGTMFKTTGSPINARAKFFSGDLVLWPQSSRCLAKMLCVRFLASYYRRER
jgi:hypothetical protein